MMTNENMTPETTTTENFSTETVHSQINSLGPKGFSIASMICGISALILCCSTSLSILLAIISITLGTITLKKHYDGRGMAIAGIVCSAIALVLAVAILIIYIYSLTKTADFFSLFY